MLNHNFSQTAYDFSVYQHVLPKCWHFWYFIIISSDPAPLIAKCSLNQSSAAFPAKQQHSVYIDQLPSNKCSDVLDHLNREDLHLQMKTVLQQRVYLDAAAEQTADSRLPVHTVGHSVNWAEIQIRLTAAGWVTLRPWAAILGVTASNWGKISCRKLWLQCYEENPWKIIVFTEYRCVLW